MQKAFVSWRLNAGISHEAVNTGLTLLFSANVLDLQSCEAASLES